MDAARLLALLDTAWDWLKPPVRRLAVLALVAIVLVAVPHALGLFEGLELVLLDMRFTTRSWWREARVDPSIITVDWDESAITVLGRWPWTWDRHARLVEVLERFGARQIGIVDDHFSTPGAITIADEELGVLEQRVVSAVEAGVTDPVQAGLPRYNELFEDEVARHGGVFLCADLFIPDEPRPGAALVPRDRERLAAVRLMDSFSLPSASGAGAAEGVRVALDAKPPVPFLTRRLAGVGFNRIVQDRDGVVRRLPAIASYDGRLYPTLAASMAADRFGARLSDARFVPGEGIEFPGARYPDGRPVRIPVDENGDMLVNWVGGYFEHITHVPFLSIAQQYAFSVGKRSLAGFAADPANPATIDAALQQCILALISTRLVTEEDAVIMGFALVDGVFARAYQEQGRSWEEFEAVHLQGSDSGELGRQRWDAIAVNGAALALLDSGETPVYADLVAALGAKDTESVRDNFEQLLWFHGRGAAEDLALPIFHQNYFTLSDNQTEMWSPLTLRDKSVFVGLTATALNALNPTPFEDRYQMLGLQPNAFNTIMTGDFLSEQPGWAVYLYVIGYALAITFLVLRLGTAGQFAASAGLAGAHVSVAWWAFGTHGIILPVVAPALAVAVSYSSSVVFLYAEAQRERRRVRGLFSAMVSPQVLRILEENPEKLSIAGEKFDATMFSSDVSGFTTISEGVTAQGLANILNIYLTPMSNIIMKYDGFVDKYEGDAIKAEFGVPLIDPEHPWKGACSALEQQEELTVIARMLLLMYGVKITARMGVNTGVVAAGNMGSEKRMQYTVMGEQVTLAEELEPINKLYESWIAIGHETDARSKGILETRHLDTVIMGPSHAAIGVFEPLGWKRDAYLAYWKGKPAPPLLLESWRRIMPEKILGYVHYYDTRTVASSPMGERIIGTYRRLKTPALDYMKTNDEVAVVEFFAELAEVDRAVAALAGQAAPADAAAPSPAGDAPSGDWQARLAQAREMLRTAQFAVEAQAGSLNTVVADELTKQIDTLEKKAESFSKRCSFPGPEDEVGWELAENLKLLLARTEASFLGQDLAPLRKRAAELRAEIQGAMGALAKELETPEGADGYHEFMADHCAVTPHKLEVRAAFDAARARYLARDWDGAEAGMRAVLAIEPTDGPAQKYLERVTHLRKAPPPADWNGHWSEE